MLVDYSKHSNRVFHAGKVYKGISKAALLRRLENGSLEVIIIRDYFLESGLYRANFETLDVNSPDLKYNLIRFFILEELC